MIIRVFNCIVFVICCATVYGLFIIKSQVRSFCYQIDELNKQISEERDKAHMLKAEMAYLTSPDRLRQLSTKYLVLDNVHSHQMIVDPLLQTVNIKTEKQYAVANLSVKHNIRWRYKKAPSKYIQRVAATKIDNYGRIQ
jgi:cell division protein FtsL